MRVLLGVLVGAQLPACLLLMDPPDGVGEGGSGTPVDGWVEVAVSASGEVCAIQEDSSLWCGSGGSLKRREGRYLGVSGDCTVRDTGEIVCGGSSGASSFELSGDFVAVTGDSIAGCGLRTNGSARCWPEANSVAGRFTSLGAGDRFACGIEDGSGRLRCWGINQLVFDEALAVPSGSYAQVDTHGNVGCGVTSGGSIECWGYDLTNVSVPPGGSSYTHVSMHRAYACGARLGRDAVCWGEDAGHPGNAHSSPPDGVELTQLDTGYDLACGIGVDSRLECWGRL